MGFFIKKKIGGLNTSIQKRGLRVSKSIGAGPFRFNVGHYFGGEMGGTTTARTTASAGGAVWQKNHILNRPQAEDKTDQMLNDYFDIQTTEISDEELRKFDEEVDAEVVHPSQDNRLSEKLVHSLMFLQTFVQIGLMFVMPLWVSLLPLWASVALLMRAVLQSHDFEIFGTSLSVLAFSWFFVSQFTIHIIVFVSSKL